MGEGHKCYKGGAGVGAGAETKAGKVTVLMPVQGSQQGGDWQRWHPGCSAPKSKEEEEQWWSRGRGWADGTCSLRREQSQRGVLTPRNAQVSASDESG